MPMFLTTYLSGKWSFCFLGISYEAKGFAGMHMLHNRGSDIAAACQRENERCNSLVPVWECIVTRNAQGVCEEQREMVL